ncbi:MAG: PepSY-like domain-containing protein [Nitrospinota bacterium]|nr:PepSY-like domain-containing protein [Nitrospinota bacterium]
MFVRQLVVPGVLLILIVAMNGCALFSKEVKLEDVPPAAQAVIQTHTSGGTIEKITCEKEEGKHFYKVEYKKDGREFELQVDDDGKVLETEEILAMEDLPPAVLETVKAESAGGEIKELALETENGNTFYEVEFEKDGKEHEVKIAEDGTVLERETK